MLFLHAVFHPGPDFAGRGQVHLVQHDDLRLARERGVERREFGVDGFEIFERVGRRAVEQVHEQARALDVPQEFVAEALSLVRAFDQAGNVGDDERGLVVERDHAQVRREGRERIVGDLGPCVRDDRKEGGLAGVGHADQADVGDQLQLQQQPAFFAGRAMLGDTRRLVGWLGKGGVAAPAPPAARREKGLPLLPQVGQQFAAVGVAQQGAERHPQVQVWRIFAVPVAAGAGAARLGFVVGVALEGREGVQPPVCHEQHVAAAAPMPAVGPAEWNEFLAAERNDAIAAVAGFHVDLDLVEKVWHRTESVPEIKMGVKAFCRLRTNMLNCGLCNDGTARL